MQSLIKLAMEGHSEPKGPMLSMEEEALLEQEVEATDVSVVQDLEEAEKSLDIVGALEDLAIVAQSIQEVSPQEAALIQIAADGIMRGTGVDGSVVAPAMEDIEGKSGAGVVARVKEVIKRILAAIKELLVELGKKLRAFMDGSNRLGEQKLKRVNELLKRAEKIEAVEAGSKTINLKGLYVVRGNLGDPKALTKGADILKAVRAHNESVEIFKHGTARFLNGLMTGASSFFSRAQTVLAAGAPTENTLDVLRKEALRAASVDLRWMARIADEDSLGRALGDAPQFDTSRRETLLGIEFAGKTWTTKHIQEAATHGELASAVAEFFRHTSVSAGSASRTAHEGSMVPLSVGEVEQLLNEVKRTARECVNEGESLNAVFKDQLEKLEKTSQELQAVVKSENLKGDVHAWLAYANIAQSVVESLTRRVNWAYSSLLRANLLIVDRCSSVADLSLTARSKK